MQKTTNVKATKLMAGDHIKIGGQLYRITSLTRAYGREHSDRVRIMLKSMEKKPVYINLHVFPSTRFDIYNQ